MVVDIAAINLMRGQVSETQYMAFLLPHIKGMKPADLDEILPFDCFQFDRYESLVYLSESKNLSLRAVRWLARVAAKAPIELFQQLCMPFFKVVFEKEITSDIPEDTHQVFDALGGSETIVGFCRQQLEAIEDSSLDEYLVSGMIMSVGFARQAQYGGLLLKFLHDYGYWDLVIQKLFEKPTMQKNFEILAKHGVLSSLENARVASQQSYGQLAEILSKDISLQRQLACLVSTNSFLITTLKLALYRKAIDEMMSDKDVHRRRAAAFVLRFMPSLQDVEPLKNGLGDADKHVRRYCLEGLSKHIGKENVEELLEEMKQGASSIKMSAEELSGFLKDKFKDVLSGSIETAGKFVDGVGNKISGIFKRRHDDT
jgi:hypothetical protein